MKIPMPFLLLLLVPVITAGCGSSTGKDAISSEQAAAANSFPDCPTCHSSQKSPSLNPMLTNGVAPAGTHSAHVTDADIVCVKCHYDYTSQVSHMNGTLDMPDPAIQLVYFDSINPNGQWINDTGPQTGSCSNLYCHSIVQTTTGGPLTLDSADHYKTPTWGGDATTCAGCHGNPPVSGSHQKHAGGGAGQYTYTCEQCHSGHVPPGSTASHADGAINTVIHATWGGAYNGDTTPGSGFSNCSNTYCHGNGTSVATGVIPNKASPTWGISGQLACNSCHGNPPSYPQMTDTTASPKANAHATQQHMDVVKSTIFGCGGCHYSTTTNGNTIANPANHVNGKYDVVVAPGLTYGGNPVTFTYIPDPGGLGGSCSTVSCHGSGSPPAFWGKVAPYIAGISITNGPSCFEAQFAVTDMINVYYPLTYTWTFGDGQTEEKKDSFSLPSSASHKYFDHTPRTVTITGRDNLQRYFSRAQTFTPQPVGNKPPYANLLVTTNRYTVTVTDLSTDADYDTCGNSLAGGLTIAWGDYFNTIKYYSIYLTNIPSNKDYTFVYYDDPTISSDRTYTITHTIVDYAGAQASNGPQTKSVAVPGQTVISGKIALSEGTGVADVTVDLKYQKGILGFFTLATTVTDAGGSYSFSGQGLDYNRQFLRVEPKSSEDISTFSPAYQDVTINRDDVNFTALPSP